MINGINSALNGLNLASQKASQASNNIANATTENVSKNINVAEEVVNLKLAETQFKANAATLRAQQELSDELLRLFDKEV